MEWMLKNRNNRWMREREREKRKKREWSKRICLFPHPSRQHDLLYRRRRFHKIKEQRKKREWINVFRFNSEYVDFFLFAWLSYIEIKKHLNRLLSVALKSKLMGFIFLLPLKQLNRIYWEEKKNRFIYLFMWLN